MKTITIALALIFAVTIDTPETPKNLCLGQVKHTSLEKALAEPDKVVYLDLAMQRPKLKSIPKEVAQFPNLVCLDVSYNQISSIPDEIKQCKKLRSLNLGGNRYLAKLPAVLKEVPSLELVDVSDIPEWSAEKRAEAKEMLPNAEVITD